MLKYGSRCSTIKLQQYQDVTNNGKFEVEAVL